MTHRSMCPDTGMIGVRITMAALLFALSASTSHAQSPALEFKGVPLGATVAELQAKMPWFDCTGQLCMLFVSPSFLGKLCPSGVPAAETMKCADQVRFGPALPDYYRAEFEDGRLVKVSINIPQFSAGQVVLALTEKYGPPSTEKTESVQNRMGATFDNRIVSWTRPDGKIRVEQRYASIDKGMVIMSSHGHEEKAAKEIDKKAKESAKKL